MAPVQEIPVIRRRLEVIAEEMLQIQQHLSLPINNPTGRMLLAACGKVLDAIDDLTKIEGK